MRFYKQPHAFYAGVDLHARSMFTHILDHAGATVFERDLPADAESFRNAIAPFRAGLLVGVECMFAWYWLADWCEDEAIPFTLGHALSYARLVRCTHESAGKKKGSGGKKIGNAHLKWAFPEGPENGSAVSGVTSC
jgi:hypothetical protein